MTTKRRLTADQAWMHGRYEQGSRLNWIAMACLLCQVMELILITVAITVSAGNKALLNQILEAISK